MKFPRTTSVDHSPSFFFDSRIFCSSYTHLMLGTIGLSIFNYPTSTWLCYLIPFKSLLLISVTPILLPIACFSPSSSASLLKLAWSFIYFSTVNIFVFLLVTVLSLTSLYLVYVHEVLFFPVPHILFVLFFCISLHLELHECRLFIYTDPCSFKASVLLDGSTYTTNLPPPAWQI